MIPYLLRGIHSKVAVDHFWVFNTAWTGGKDKYVHRKEPLTDDTLAAHWQREVSLGVSLIRRGESVTHFLCFDVDNHNGENSEQEMEGRLLRIIHAGNLCGLRNPLVWRTSPQGYRVDYYWSDAHDAKQIRALGHEVLGEANVDCEIFPKQNEVAETGWGGCISLVGGRDSCLLDDDFKPLPREAMASFVWHPCPPLEVAVTYSDEVTVEVSGTPRDWGSTPVNDILSSNAVPVEGRNISLNRVLYHFRKEGWGEAALEGMAVGLGHLKWGLPKDEVLDLVKRAVRHPPNETAIAEGDFQSVTRIVPRVNVNSSAEFVLVFRGQSVSFANGTELRSASTVATKILEACGVLIELPLRQWRDTLAALMENCVTVTTDGETEDDSQLDAVLAFVGETLDARAIHDYELEDRTAFLAGFPVVVDDRVYFHPDAAMVWAKKHGNGRGLNRNRLFKLLRAHGIGGRDQLYVKKGVKRPAAWVLLECLDNCRHLADRLASIETRRHRFGVGDVEDESEMARTKKLLGRALGIGPGEEGGF